MKKIVFPKVGFRIIKTMITVIICLLIKFIITTLWNNSLVDQLYSPFFTSVGACYSLSSNRKDTLKQAQVRSFGSILGGVFALVVLYLSLGLNSLFGFYQNGQVVNNLYTLVEYILIALLIIGLIWSCVFFKMSHITYIACLTYMSVTVGNVAGVPNYIFAANRVLSTIFGVLVALGINLANIHLYNNHHNILVVTTTGCILNRDNSLSNYQKYQLNNLAERNAPIYYATTRSSASLDEIFSKVLITNPLVIMNGAAIFDFNKKYTL
ncbi:MAG: HAD hydrolase family protein [Acholeplasmatales bacterium]|jgi:hypothetical protein|nr:HAD hydrolase family protein [Acholeplasmatales bacterium]